MLNRKWKLFFLELYTSKSWGYGKFPGRYAATAIGLNIYWFVGLIIKLVIRGEEVKGNYFYALLIFNGIFLVIFLCSTLHSIFKEKKIKQFIELLKDSWAVLLERLHQK